MKYLTADNWQELFTRFPGLEGAMLAMEHNNELQALIHGHNHGRLNEWERARLDELRALLWPSMEYREASHGI